MNTRELDSLILKSGMSIAKDKLLDALRRTPDKQLPCIKDASSGYLIIRVKVA